MAYESYSPGAAPQFAFPSRRKFGGDQSPLAMNSLPQSGAMRGARFAQPNIESPQFGGQEGEQDPSVLDRVLMGVGEGLQFGGILPSIIQQFAEGGDEDDEEGRRRFGHPGSAYTPNF